jgi:hypothetical protein
MAAGIFACNSAISLALGDSSIPWLEYAIKAVLVSAVAVAFTHPVLKKAGL